MAGSERAVGIDLGTTFSVVSYLDNEGKPQTVQNSEGDLTTPSVVYFGNEETVVGKEAVKVAQYEPNSIAQFAKRDVGKSQLHNAINGQKMPPEAIQAVILKKLRNDAVLKVGEFSKVVITVPAFFNEPRRKATMDAGKLAGLDVVDIINEPTAAAIAYGVQEGFITTKGETERRETVMVYDLGGGTFDVTLMEIDGVHYKTLATGGDVHLGGIDWDQCVVNHVADEFEKKYSVDPRKDPEARQTLLQEAEDAKRALSARATTTIHFAHEGNRLKIDLSREQFESLTAALLQRTIFTANRVLKEGGRKWSDLTRLLLVGGSTRMPMIQEALEKESGMKPDRSVSPDESVAYGAALYCGFLLGGASSSVPEMKITNVSSHDLGVLGFERETGLPRRGIIIPRNTALPAKGASRFTTQQDNQNNVKVQVVEGGDASGKNATHIGKCVVTDLPESLPAGTPVLVKFYYATNGRLKVAATLGKTKHDATMVVERASGLSDKMITQWKQWLDDGGLIQGEADPEPERVEPTPAKPAPTKAEPAKPQAAKAAPNLPVPVEPPSGSVLDQLDDAALAEMEDLDFDEDSFAEEDVSEALPADDTLEDIPMAEAVPAEGSPMPDNIDVPEPSEGGLSFDFDADEKPSDDGPSDWSFLDG